jgi:glycosyltransferase involved in cell wall biosynthesis
MHICHLIAHLRLGAGRYIADLAIEQVRCGHFVSVCLSDDEEGNWKSDPGLIAEMYEAGVNIVMPGDYFHRSVEGLHRAAKIMRENSSLWAGGGIAHAHTAMGAVVARWSGAPKVVCTCHGWSLSRQPEYDLQDAIAFLNCNVILSPSRYWADFVSRVAGRCDVKVQPLGFDLSRYPESKTVYNKDRNSEKIVCVAEMTARKGQAVLMDAMPLVWARYPNAHLTFMGKGDAEQELMARSKGVDPGGRRIHFRGFVMNPFLSLGEFDVMCLPTLSDNQPVAIIEAMLAGLPVVSTQVGGIPELLAMGQCGDCVTPGDAVAMAGGLIKWLSMPPGELRMRSDSARSLARELFDIKSHALKIESHYREALSG